MEYFLIWIPGLLIASGALFLLAYMVERTTGLKWPLRYLSNFFGWVFLALLWIAMMPFVIAGLIFGGFKFDHPAINERASPEASPRRSIPRP